MFSLIITIVSIALVAALAVATIYYGGDVMSQGQASAKASTIVNGGEQIAAAISLYRLNTGAWPASVEVLRADGYLNGLPEIAAADGFSFIASAHAAPVVTGDWLYDSEVPHLAYVGTITMEVCAEVNKHASSRRQVLNVLDPGAKVQCVAAGAADPVVVFRNTGVAATDMPVLPGNPSIGAPGIISNPPDGTCVYGCDGAPGPGDGGGGGGGGGGGTTEPPVTPDPDPVDAEPDEWTNWQPCPTGGPGSLCSPDIGDWEGTSADYYCTVPAGYNQVRVTGEVYTSTEAGSDGFGLSINGNIVYQSGNELLASGETSWTPFSYAAPIDTAGGSTTVTVRFFKDASGSAGADQIGVRNIQCTPEDPEPVDDGNTDPDGTAAGCPLTVHYATDQFQSATPDRPGTSRGWEFKNLTSNTYQVTQVASYYRDGWHYVRTFNPAGHNDFAFDTAGEASSWGRLDMSHDLVPGGAIEVMDLNGPQRTYSRLAVYLSNIDRWCIMSFNGQRYEQPTGSETVRVRSRTGSDFVPTGW